jgi:hypothetical protein
MANYKVNEKSKTISVSGTLTEIERTIVSTYITSGYKIKEKRKSTAATVGDDDIIKYFQSQVDDEGNMTAEAEKLYKEYEAKKVEKMKDKNGKERKSGFLIALKWLKEEHYEIYDVLMEKAERDPKKTEARRKAKKKKDAEAAKKAAEEAAEEENAEN